VAKALMKKSIILYVKGRSSRTVSIWVVIKHRSTLYINYQLDALVIIYS